MNTKIKCPINRPFLVLGSSGQVVTEMQKVLNQRLLELPSFQKEVSVTGYFGQNTLILVKYLQCIVFLPVDGIVGPKTWAYMCEGVASLPQLSLGSTGPLVKSVQEELNNTQYYCGAIDGNFGAKTALSVKAFQISRHLPDDGIIEQQTWTELIKLDTHVQRCEMQRGVGV
ncbi:MAG: peptidoglycan-binding protein [Stigonema ocellatum SAG 48.90 = DSM 106950]|nr:peptidoglycan-binding protein [Stigonema ocellatum SAG 48.90 = DSM 106950]